MGKHSAIGIRMATGPLQVYPMHEEPSISHSRTNGEQVSACSPEDGCKNQSCCSSSSPITSSQHSVDYVDVDYDVDVDVDEPLAMDIVRTMCRQEATIYHHPASYYVEHVKHHKHHHGNSSSSSSTRRKKKNLETMDSWRSSLIQWMYQVADFSHVRRETVGVAVYFLDVAISKIIVPAMNRNSTCRNQQQQQQQHSSYCLEDYKVSFQLAAATALQLAIKTQDCRLIKLADLVILGRNAFTERDIARMQVQIIEACGWYLHPPSVYCYLHQYQSLLWDLLPKEEEHAHDNNIMKDSKATISKVMYRITELILPQSQFKSYPPSILAYAIMLVAMTFTTGISPQQRQRFSRQLSLALVLILPNEEDHSSQDSSSQQQQQQQFLLLQAIQQVQASCRQCPHLDFAGIVRDMVIFEGSTSTNNRDGKPTTLCLVCLTMEEYTRFTGGPKTPPTSSSVCYTYSSSSSIVPTIHQNQHSPISVVEDHGDSSSSFLLQQQQQQPPI